MSNEPEKKYKSISHWFSYNWGWVLGAVLLALFLFYTHVIQDNGPKPDYTIGWVGTSPLSESELDAISSAVASAGADQNGDGLVTTSVTEYIINFDLTPDDYGYQNAYADHLKLLAQIQANEFMLFLLEDPEGFQASTGVLRYLDGSIPGEEDQYESANWQRMCVPWQPDGLEREAYLACRAIFSGKDSEKLFPGAEVLFGALTDGC